MFMCQERDIRKGLCDRAKISGDRLDSRSDLGVMIKCTKLNGGWSLPAKKMEEYWIFLAY